MLELVLSSVGSAALVAAALWLGRTWIKERLTASIRLDTERDLAKLKSDLDRASQRIKDVAFAGTSANAKVEGTLLEHRISAVNKVWESVLSWQAVSAATTMVSFLSEDWLKRNASHPGTKSTFEQLLKDADHLNFMKRQNDTELVRPFLSEQIWALYAAYHSFLSARLVKASLLAIPSIDHAEVLSRFNERELVQKSAPAEIFAAYDNNPHVGTEPYLRYLREEMLMQFREFLSGERAGNLAAQDAARILHAAEDLAARSSGTSNKAQHEKDA
ncbi:hypothetical protein ATN89_24155 [Comamonas thiooxydans]|uniref:hypothetical protein n=1 Tax=Comamonas thiooxydans TaxID=363952 RepID=UPI0007C4BFBB|nr:hypothetical protein [Comamonas thiooxydans]OAD81586.1 hypothetical protein ATN89_24155 [Comamonas thiooxydans]